MERSGDQFRLPLLPKWQDYTLGLIFLLAWAIPALIRHWDAWPPDLSALYMAAKFYASGQFELIYAVSDKMTVWKEAIEALNRADAYAFPYFYPPLWAALASPFASLPPETFFNAVMILHIAMIAGSVVLAFRIARPKIPFYVWSIASVFILSLSLISELALFHNQIQISVTFLTLLAFERYQSGAKISAGLALALAASLKLSPAVLGLIFLLDKDMRAIASSVISGLLLLALSVMIAGIDLHAMMLESLQKLTGQVTRAPINWNMENALLEIQSLWSGIPLAPIAGETTHLEEPLWLTITNTALLLGLTLWVIRQTRSRAAARLMGLLMVFTLTGPLAWIYHYLAVLLLLPIVFSILPLGRALTVIGLFTLATSITAFETMSRLSQSNNVQTIWGVLVILILLLMLTTSRDGQKAP